MINLVSINKIILSISVIGFSALMTGCSSEFSENVETEDIYLVATVEVDASLQARIRVELKEGNLLGRAIEISGQDRLTLDFNGTNIPLTKDRDLLDIDYEGSIDTLGQSGQFNVNFSRANSDPVTVSATLGSPFSITSPVSGASFSDDDSYVYVTWDNADDNTGVILRATLSCLTVEDDGSTEIDHENETYTLADTGSGDFPLFELIFNIIAEITLEDEEIVASEPCDLAFSLAKMDEVILPQFASNSFIRVEQVRQSSTFKVFGIDSD